MSEDINENEVDLRQQLPDKEEEVTVDELNTEETQATQEGSQQEQVSASPEQSLTSASNQGYDETIPVSDLPSQGAVYSFDEIPYRDFGVPEADRLETASPLNFQQTIRDVLQDCTQIDINNLSYGDTMFLFIYFRVQSWTADYPIGYECGTCDHFTEDYQFDLTQLQQQNLDEDFTEPQIFDFGDKKVKMKMLRVRDVQRVENLLENNADKFDRNERSLNVAARKACMIEEATDCGNSITQKIQWMDSYLSAKENGVLNSWIKKNAHGIKQNVEVECENCGNEVEKPLEFKQELFYPDPDSYVNLDDYTVDS